ncbi:MAG TPA: hypothetical protein VK365_07535, partial [Nocardioidaceae bacterium]|nr:hypothetical protein [Nocardioidaceae bacterium]
MDDSYGVRLPRCGDEAGSARGPLRLVTEVARATSERGGVVLRRRDDGTLELRVNGVFVMDDDGAASEQALATVGMAAVVSPRRVLVGGLGLGFTLRAVLEDPRVEQVTVVELEPV